jgi:hypothetical protein
MPNIGAFITELQSYSCPDNVFNPWSDWVEEIDIGSDAPIIRSAQLEQYLRLRSKRVKWIFVAEALGYQGGRFTGIAMTSERILLGWQKNINPSNVLSLFEPKRTSNSLNPLFKKSQKRSGFTEPTATVVWKEIEKCGIDPFQIILWNIFPFHPFKDSGGPLSNRTPNSNELQLGITYVRKLIEFHPSAKVISIGKHSNRLLNQHEIDNSSLPHPANGGINDFKNAMRGLFLKD